MYARLDRSGHPLANQTYLLRAMTVPMDRANPLSAASGSDGWGSGVGGDKVGGEGGERGEKKAAGLAPKTGDDDNKDNDALLEKLSPHGRIFLGRDEGTYGTEGIGWEAYDPDFECGGPPGADGRICPHVLREAEARGREGRPLHVSIASYR